MDIEKFKERKVERGGYRCPGHDYTSRCIYHIVLNKSEGVAPFSSISGSYENPYVRPVVARSAIGEIITQELTNLKSQFPWISILCRAIMPDHIHFVIFVREKTEIHLGEIIGHFKRMCSLRYQALGGAEGIRLFVDNYNDTFLKGNGQLQSMIRYVYNNSRRYLEQRDKACFFRRFKIRVGESVYDAYGNPRLLEFPVIDAVRISRRYSLQELRELKMSWRDNVYNGGVLVSPFVSEGEKKVRNWAVMNGGSLGLVVAEGLGEKYKPGGGMFDFCAEGRLVVIFGNLRKEEVKGGFTQFDDRKYSRSECLQMNDLAAILASGDFQVLV